MTSWDEAHSEWHRNTGQAFGCPWDACPRPDDFDTEAKMESEVISWYKNQAKQDEIAEMHVKFCTTICQCP